MHRYFVLVLFCTLSLSGCSFWDKGSSSKDESPFRIEDPGATSLVTLKKGYLGREFILKVSSQQNGNVAEFQAVASRIVYFELRGRELAMIQSSKGIQKSSSLKQSFPIFTFSVQRQNLSSVVFDLASGFDSLYIMPGESVDTASQRPIPTAYDTAFSLKLNGRTANVTQIAQNGGLDFQQSAITGFTDFDQSHHEIFYRLELYRKNESFAPYENQVFENFAFFENQAYYEFDDRRTVSRANRFDISKPVEFFISANTPEAYRGAVKEGVLYWNKAYGKEVLKVSMAPLGLTAPDFDKNIIQWVDAPSVAMAYADSHTDPRTGEITNAHVWFGSGWLSSVQNDFLSSEYSLNAFEKKSKKNASSKTSNVKKHCSHFHSNAIEMLLKRTQHLNLSKERMQVLLADVVRMIVAHEIGHLLGLRHNFAGSVASAKSPSQSLARFNEIAANPLLQVLENYSSSVMDYLPEHAMALLGKKIKEDHESLEYDRMAIETLYFQENYPKEQWPAFCTDQLADSNVLDCKRYDLGNMPITSAIDRLNGAVDRLATDIPDAFISELYYRGAHATEQLSINLDPQWVVEDTLGPLHTVLQAVSSETTLLQTKRDGVFDPEAKLVSENAYADLISRNIEAIGGWEEAFHMIQGLDLHSNKQKALEYINSHDYRSYGFSNEQILSIEGQVGKIFDLLEQSFRKEAIRVLSEYSDVRDGKIGEDFSAFLLKAQTAILYTAPDNTEISAQLIDKTKDVEEIVEMSVVIPKYKYSLEERFLAASLVAPGKGHDLGWALKQKSASEKYFNSHLHDVLHGEDKSVFELELQDRDFSQWLLEVQEIESALNSSYY